MEKMLRHFYVIIIFTLLLAGYSYASPTTVIYKKGEPIQTFFLHKGIDEIATLAAPHDIRVSLPQSDLTELKIDITLPQTQTHFAKVGDPFGHLKVHLNGKLLTQSPLVVVHAVNATPPLWLRFVYGVRRAIMRVIHWF